MTDLITTTECKQDRRSNFIKDEYMIELSILTKQKIKQLMSIKVEHSLDILSDDFYNPLQSPEDCERFNIRMSPLNQIKDYRTQGIWYIIDYKNTSNQIKNLDILHTTNNWSYIDNNGDKQTYKYFNELITKYFEKYMKISVYVLSNIIMPNKLDSFIHVNVTKHKSFKVYKSIINIDTLNNLKRFIIPKDYQQCFILLIYKINDVCRDVDLLLESTKVLKLYTGHSKRLILILIVDLAQLNQMKEYIKDLDLHINKDIFVFVLEDNKIMPSDPTYTTKNIKRLLHTYGYK